MRETAKRSYESKHSARLDSESSDSMLNQLKEWNAGQRAPRSDEPPKSPPPASQRVTLLRMVRIVWIDSCSRSGWASPDAARSWSAEVLTVQSVGFLFSDEPYSVVLAQSFDSNQDPNPNGMLQIPRSAIQSIHKVLEGTEAEFEHLKP
jgi:hypothetical protein